MYISMHWCWGKPNWSFFLFNIWKKIAEWIVFVQFNFNSEFYNYVEFWKYTRFVTSATWMNENEWISIYSIFYYFFFFARLTIPFCNFKRYETKNFHISSALYWGGCKPKVVSIPIFRSLVWKIKLEVYFIW